MFEDHLQPQPQIALAMSKAPPCQKRFRGNEIDADSNERQDDPDQTPLFGSPAPSSLPRKYKCQHCNERFRSRSNLNLHAFIHSEQRRQQIIKTTRAHVINISGLYKCRKCHCIFKSKALRNEHEYIRHQYPFICTSCHKRYAEARHLIRHVHIRHPEEIHGGSSPVVMSPRSAIRAVLAVPDELELVASPQKSPSLPPPPPLPPVDWPNHVVQDTTVDNDNPDQNFEAQVSRANEIFKKAAATAEPTVERRGGRKQKSPTPIAPKRFQCDLCHNDYAFKQYMELHRRTHFEDFACKCKYCGRGFTVYANLKAHLRVHTGEKPYECSVCQKKFSQKPNMTNHMKRAHNHQSE